MIVLDACAAVEMVRKSIEGMALRQFMLKGEKAISCELYRAETANVFRKLVRLENMSVNEAIANYTEAIALVDEFHSIQDLQNEAFCESMRLDHSTYDLFYFVLARRMGATLFTLDRKLMRLCEQNGVQCVSEIEF